MGRLLGIAIESGMTYVDGFVKVIDAGYSREYPGEAVNVIVCDVMMRHLYLSRHVFLAF